MHNKWENTSTAEAGRGAGRTLKKRVKLRANTVVSHAADDKMARGRSAAAAQGACGVGAEWELSERLGELGGGGEVIAQVGESVRSNARSTTAQPPARHPTLRTAHRCGLRAGKTC